MSSETQKILTTDGIPLEVSLKKAEKNGNISEDSHREYGDEVQKLTDAYVTKMDEALTKKEEEILQV